MSTYLADAAENLTVDGPSATFTYRRFGPTGNTPLVLLNRVRGTLDWWDPELLDHLAAEHDVIVFDNVGTGYTTGTPRDSVEGMADGAVEFIEALGLAQVDLLGWTLGGTVAQHITRTRPDLVRRLVVAAANPGGTVPGAPDPDPKVRATMTKPEVTGDDLVFLFFPETDTGRAAGHAHLARVSARLATGLPAVSEAAAMGQLTAIAKDAAIPFEQVRADLASIHRPVLYATGMQDVMITPLAAYTAVRHLPHATLVAYSDAGHAFLFQRAEDFATQVTAFLAG
ncbi:alpha/beta fold hydrolase [Streptomyces acidiscabies]|uniref:Alpha/beta hydrolase n=1 Tax=Streptomyces acidiscabies TaxID=42234 RepID=A0AAP6BET7_9ACTN|nr:alpha/beta hydrolase [Streptomyces acidiscabies]MBZ3913593.1 alpha/beta hydrolase [Streptomyces acidiscabies]MDX2963431.1 alpha/beta hydrolase [Streptomyces acidiscabies]MDX3023165.1 alpha/beta hydrolase [Streptomyces acidiscabies]MDX3792691.1 alpha/beta hydrolase [Streptomyces acidiscabies]GAQ51364.1 acyl-CoA esterase [Streptomyces acidiscabies]